MNLPLVDTFTPPYEAWDRRPPTCEEMIANGHPGYIKNRRIACIGNARAAAEYTANDHENNALDNFIKSALGNSLEYKAWQQAMPSKTPPAISSYQKDYKNSDLNAVSKDINEHGGFLSSGQCLFHGGLWVCPKSHVTTRPLSTSLSPQVALINALWEGKAYDNDRLDLIVLKATASSVNAYVFKHRGTKLGNEREVLLASGVCLTLKTASRIRSDFSVEKYDHLRKLIPIYVLEVEVS